VYDASSFIAEFGGTVDLFIGFSFFTIAQLIEIGIAAMVRLIRRRRKSVGGDNGRDDKLNTSKELQPSNDNKGLSPHNGESECYKNSTTQELEKNPNVCLDMT
jgi:hypothetical protein